jgi:hypothetical protein
MFGDLPPTDDVKCACGRDLEDAEVMTYSSINGTFRFHRCECGVEWTDHEPLEMVSMPVSADVVKQFHEECHDFRGSMDADGPRGVASRFGLDRAGWPHGLLSPR